MNLKELNELAEPLAFLEFYKCCACQKLCQDLVKNRPYDNREELYATADSLWKSYSQSEFLEAFNGHSKIGDLNSLREKYANTAAWSHQEQAGMQSVSESVLQELMQLNQEYEQKFGFIFIVCATGKSAIEMLEILKSRIKNDFDQELLNASEEQSKITRIRLEKLL